MYNIYIAQSKIILKYENDIMQKRLLDDNFFANECSNPVAWHKQHSTAYGTFNNPKYTYIANMDVVNDMRRTIITEQYSENRPEYVWNLFLYNTFVSFNYIIQCQSDEALKIINETENILDKLTRYSTDFLNSVKCAMYHITLTTKGYVLTKCHSHLSIADLGSFIMPYEMDATNAAALLAVKSDFSARFVNGLCILPKICLLRAIHLNPEEPEWHYMLSCCLTEYRKRLCMMTKVLPEELDEAKIAVKLSNNNPHYKCNLAKLLHYVNFSDNLCTNNDTLKLKAKRLIKDVINESDDVFILRRCLKILTKILMSPTQNNNTKIELLVELILIPKIINSNNGSVHESVGQYYMHYKKDLEKAITYMKIASDNKCFAGSINYVSLLFKLDPVNTNVVEILNGYLDKYPFLSCQQILLSLLIAYHLINQNNFLEALKYIDKLLDIKFVSFTGRIKAFKNIFQNSFGTFNLLDVIFNELEKNLKNESLSEENLSSINRIFQKLNTFSNNCSDTKCMHVKWKIFNSDLDSKIAFLIQTNIIEGKCCMQFSRSNLHDKPKVTEISNNWRTLKPNDGPNAFTLSYQNAKSRYSARPC